MGPVKPGLLQIFTQMYWGRAAKPGARLNYMGMDVGGFFFPYSSGRPFFFP